MQTHIQLVTSEKIDNNVSSTYKKYTKPKLNSKVEKVLFYSMLSFLSVYLYAQYF